MPVPALATKSAPMKWHAVGPVDAVGPWGPQERRINAAGGFVKNNRVDGALALSRALGDWDYKSDPQRSAATQKAPCCFVVLAHALAQSNEKRVPHESVAEGPCTGLDSPC